MRVGKQRINPEPSVCMLIHLCVTGWHKTAWLSTENAFRMCRFIRCRWTQQQWYYTIPIRFKVISLDISLPLSFWFQNGCREQMSEPKKGVLTVLPIIKGGGGVSIILTNTFYVRDLKHQSNRLNSAVRHWEEVYSLIKACFNFCVWWGNWCFLPSTNQQGVEVEHHVSKQDGSEETHWHMLLISS